MFCRHTGAIDDRWVRFMQFQIKRARGYFDDAQAGVNQLDENARWPVWSALILYRCPLGCLLRELMALGMQGLTCPHLQANFGLHRGQQV